MTQSSHQHRQYFSPSLILEEPQEAPLSNGPLALSHIYYPNRSSGEMRTRNAAAAAAVGQNNNTSSTPTPTTPNGHGHAHARNLSGAAPFEMTARSPPNSNAATTKSVLDAVGSSRLYLLAIFLLTLICCVQIRSMCRASSSGKAPVKLAQPVRSFTPPMLL
jgi:hypothetical protein